MTDDEIGTALIGCALKVHSDLGPGLLESVYEVCLTQELKKLNIKTARQLSVPIVYDGLSFDEGFRIDILVADSVVVELKTVENFCQSISPGFLLT